MGCGHSKSAYSRASRTIHSYQPLPRTENEVIETLKTALATMKVSEPIDSQDEVSMTHKPKNTVPMSLSHTASKSEELTGRQGNVESFIIVWFGDCQSLELCKSNLQQIIYDIHTFQSDAGACIDFIKSVVSDKIFFIQSEVKDDQVISEIHDWPQVESIYLFTSNSEANIDAWDRLYRKFKGIFIDTLTMIERLDQDARQVDRNLLGMLFLAETNEVPPVDQDSEPDPSFMYAQLVIEGLLRLTNNNIEKMMAYCRAQYLADDNIEEFDDFQRDYDPSNAIWWFTRKGHLYKMLTTALRKQDILTIYKMHIFIRDLHHQLVQLRNEQDLFDKQMIFYRSQVMSLDEFQKIRASKNGFLSITNLFSAYDEKDTALNLASQLQGKPDTIAVLFEIEVNGILSKNTPLANIDVPSYFVQSPREYLFFACSVFSIGEVQEMIDGIWCVHLTMTIDNNPNIIQLSEDLQECIQAKHPVDGLAYLFCDMGKVEEAQQVYLDTLSTLDSSEILLRAEFLTTLGLIQKDVSKGIPYLEEALTIMIAAKGANHSDLAQYFANLGFSQRDLGRKNEAFVNIKRGLELEVYSTKPNLENVGTFAHYMGHILADQGKYAEALVFHRNALDIQYQIYPSIHSQIAIALHIISNRYQNMKKFHEALPLLQKCLDIQLVILPSGHFRLVSTYWKMANILYVMNRFEEALASLEKAIEHGLIGDSAETEKYRQIAETLRKKVSSIKRQKHLDGFRG